MALLAQKVSIFVSRSYKDVLRLGISLNCWMYVFIIDKTIMIVVKKAYLAYIQKFRQKRLSTKKYGRY